MSEDLFKAPVWQPELRSAWTPAFPGQKDWVQDITGWSWTEVVEAVTEYGVKNATIDYDMLDWDRPLAVLVWPAGDDQ